MLIAEILDTPVDEYRTLNPAIGHHIDDQEFAEFERARFKLVSTPISDQFEVRYRREKNLHDYYIYDPDTKKSVGIFTLETLGKMKVERVLAPGTDVVIPHLSLTKKYQGQGIGFRIYTSFLKQGNFVYTTDAHTKAAQALWDKLSGLPGMINFYYDHQHNLATTFPITDEPNVFRYLGRKELFQKFKIISDKREYEKAR